MFNYDWFHGSPFAQQREEAQWRCACRRYPDVEPGDAESHPEFMKFLSELESRMLIYLRDGFSYEVSSLAEVETKSHLVFECMPVDEQYKVGAFVVTVPFEEIVRVEVFSVHPSEKPSELPQITGFRAPSEVADPVHRPIPGRQSS